MKRLVAMDPSHRLSRSMPLLLPHSSYLPPSYTATSSRWAQRGRHRHRTPRHDYYINGVRTTLIGAGSYPNIHRYPQRIIVCGAGVSFQKLTRSSSVLELSRSGVYSSTETVCGSRTPRRTASCDDVSRGRHTPSWDSRCSESGVSLNDSRTDVGSDCRTEEAGSVSGLEDVDAGSQCSFGSSSAFHELTCDSELDRLDSDAVSGSGSLYGLDRAEDEDYVRDCLQGDSTSKALSESWGGVPISSSHSPVSAHYHRPRCSPFDPSARFSRDPTTTTKTTPIHSSSSSPTLVTRRKEQEKTKTGLTRISYDPKRFAGCIIENGQQVCVSSAFRNDCAVESLVPAARGHSELNSTRLAPPSRQHAGSSSPAAALISKQHALNTQHQQQQQQQQQQHPPPSASADSHHRVTEWVQLLELGPIVKIPGNHHPHHLQEKCDVVKDGVESDHYKQDCDSQNGGVSDSPAPVTREGGRGEADFPPPSAFPSPLPPRGDGKKQPYFCEEDEGENATGRTIPLLTQSIKPALLSSSSSAAAATASEEKNNVDKTCERNSSSLRGETAADCVKNSDESSCSVNECLAHNSSTTNIKVGVGGDDRNPTLRLSSHGDVDVLRGGDVNPRASLSSPSVDVLRRDGVNPTPCLSSHLAVDASGRGQTADGARNENGGGGGNTIPAYQAVTRADRHYSDPAGRFLSHFGRSSGSSLSTAALEGEEKRGGEEGGSVTRFSAAVTACPTPPPSTFSPFLQATYSCGELSFPITNHHAVNCPFLPLPHHHHQHPALSTTTITPALDRCGSSPTPLPCRGQVGRAQLQQDWRCTQSSAALSTHLEAFAHTLPPPPTGEKPRQHSLQSQSVGSLPPQLPEQKGPEGSNPTVLHEFGLSQAGRHKDITGARHLTGFPFLTDGTTKSDVTKAHCQGQGEFFVRGTATTRGVKSARELGLKLGLKQTVREKKKEEPASAGPTHQPPPFIAGEWRGRGHSPHPCEDASLGMSASNRSVTIPPAHREETHVCFSHSSLQEKRRGERDTTTSTMAGNEHANNSNASFNILDSLQQQLSMLSSEDTFNYSSDPQSCGESGQVYWYRDHAEASLPHAHSEASSCVIQSSRSAAFTSETTNQWQQQQQQTAQVFRSDFSSRDSFREPGGSGGASEWNVDYFSAQRHGSAVSNTKQEASFRHGRASQAVSVWGKTVCEGGNGEGSGGMVDEGSVQSPPQSIQWQRPVSSSEQEDSDGNYTSLSSTESSHQHHSQSESEFISDGEKEDYDNLDTFNDFVFGLQGQFTSDRPSQHHRTDLVTSEFRSNRLRSCIQETILEADDESETADELDTTTTTVSSYRSTFHYSLPQSTPKQQAVSSLPEIRLWSADEHVTTLSSDDRMHTMSPLHPLQDLSDKLSSFSDASFELHTLQDSFTLEDANESRHSACSSPAPSDVSESSMYSSSATAEVRKQAESTTRVKMAESSQTVKAVRRNLSQTFAQDTHRSVRSSPAAVRPPAAKKAKWVEDNVFLFQKMLNDLESQCRSSEQVLMEEMVSLESGRGGGDAECGVGKSSDSYHDLYRSFTQETLEKRQNHVCPFVEDHLPVLRFKRFLKKKHNSKLKGQRTFRVRHRLDKLAESTATVGESVGKSFNEGDSQNIERTITVISRGKPTPCLLPKLSSPTGIHDMAESSTFPDDDADARRSLSDSAYSTLSDATSQPISDLSSRGDDLGSRGDDISSIATDISLDSDKLASLNDVFDQLDVCEGEIDHALLDRLQVCHYKADTL